MNSAFSWQNCVSLFSGANLPWFTPPLFLDYSSLVSGLLLPCFWITPPLFLFSLLSLISSCLNLPFGTQGRSGRLNEAYVLQTRNREYRKDLYLGTPQGPAQFQCSLFLFGRERTPEEYSSGLGLKKCRFDWERRSGWASTRILSGLVKEGILLNCHRYPLLIYFLSPINPEYSLEGQHWSRISNTLATWYEQLTHWKRPMCWKRLRTGGEEEERGWDGWMASATQWT